MIRERILRIHIDDGSLKFDTDEQIKEFQYQLGRSASYGMTSGANDGMELLEMFISGESRTISTALFPPIPWMPMGEPESHAPFLELSAALDAFRVGEPSIVFTPTPEMKK